MNGDVLSEFIDFVIENCESPLNKSESIDFLTDFIYSIHNKNDFDISLRDVAKWLKINVNALKKTIHRSYKNKKDYIIDRQYTSGRPRCDIYISNNCFKSICLRSNSGNGEKIRQYFIMIEDIYREHMTQIISNRQRIDTEEYDYKGYQPTKYPLGHCVYIIQITYRGLVSYKIGRTKNLNRRLSEHRREFAGKIKLILYELYQHHDFLEICIHRFLSKTRKRNELGNLVEIFEAEVPILIKLIKRCRSISEDPIALAIADSMPQNST